jgi:hypothetical protein
MQFPSIRVPNCYLLSSAHWLLTTETADKNVTRISGYDARAMGTFLETLDIQKECLFTHDRGRGEECGARRGPEEGEAALRERRHAKFLTSFMLYMICVVQCGSGHGYYVGFFKACLRQTSIPLKTDNGSNYKQKDYQKLRNIITAFGVGRKS